MVIDSYQDPDHLIVPIEAQDLFGKNCLWYILHFNLNSILNTKIFDFFIRSKWDGRIIQNMSILEFSTSWNIL